MANDHLSEKVQISKFLYKLQEKIHILFVFPDRNYWTSKIINVRLTDILNNKEHANSRQFESISILASKLLKTEKLSFS